MNRGEILLHMVLRADCRIDASTESDEPEVELNPPISYLSTVMDRIAEKTSCRII
jgi:hypothetical protein